MRFVDTNILLYAISSDETERERSLCAARLLDDGDLALSAQVLQEFYVQATRPTARSPLSHEMALKFIRTLDLFPVQEVTRELVLAAAEARARWRISYWDAAIVEAARQMGCREILTEDLQDGRDFDGCWVVNPFRDIP
jgi:predicted nucleic acid-binding protein